MPTTVISAFAEFMEWTVNLAPTDTDTARASRRWLLEEQIEAFPDRHADFPFLYGSNGEFDLPFGSFARNTKIRPLDDIDQISCLHADGASYVAYSNDDVQIEVPASSRLHAYCHDETSTLNSRKIVNRYVRALQDVPQYSAAAINRRSEAATLKLSSYAWNFDIVPAFITAPDVVGRNYFLIPNGKGHWKKTDPRMDRDRVFAINRFHDGNMLNIVRLVKYWHRRPTMPSMSSYLLECILMDHFENLGAPISQFPDLGLAAAFDAVQTRVLYAVSDPKRIQDDLNDLTWADRVAISERAALDAQRTREARALEGANDHRGSIEKWREIFGIGFPQYG
jgi:hypothetical protein